MCVISEYTLLTHLWHLELIQQWSNPCVNIVQIVCNLRIHTFYTPFTPGIGLLHCWTKSRSKTFVFWDNTHFAQYLRIYFFTVGPSLRLHTFCTVFTHPLLLCCKNFKCKICVILKFTHILHFSGGECTN